MIHHWSRIVEWVMSVIQLLLQIVGGQINDITCIKFNNRPFKIFFSKVSQFSYYYNIGQCECNDCTKFSQPIRRCGWKNLVLHATLSYKLVKDSFSRQGYNRWFLQMASHSASDNAHSLFPASSYSFIMRYGHSLIWGTFSWLTQKSVLTWEMIR